MLTVAGIWNGWCFYFSFFAVFFFLYFFVLFFLQSWGTWFSWDNQQQWFKQSDIKDLIWIQTTWFCEDEMGTRCRPSEKYVFPIITYCRWSKTFFVVIMKLMINLPWPKKKNYDPNFKSQNVNMNIIFKTMMWGQKNIIVLLGLIWSVALLWQYLDTTPESMNIPIVDTVKALQYILHKVFVERNINKWKGKKKKNVIECVTLILMDVDDSYWLTHTHWKALAETLSWTPAWQKGH